MLLREWIKTSGISVQSFAHKANVERAMVYRYLSGSVPRVQTLRRIERITNGAVTAQDFYNAAIQKSEAELPPP